MAALSESLSAGSVVGDSNGDDTSTDMPGSEEDWDEPKLDHGSSGSCRDLATLKVFKGASSPLSVARSLDTEGDPQARKVTANLAKDGSQARQSEWSFGYGDGDASHDHWEWTQEEWTEWKLFRQSDSEDLG